MIDLRRYCRRQVSRIRAIKQNLFEKPRCENVKAQSIFILSTFLKGFNFNPVKLSIQNHHIPYKKTTQQNHTTVEQTPSTLKSFNPKCLSIFSFQKTLYAKIMGEKKTGNLRKKNFQARLDCSTGKQTNLKSYRPVSMISETVRRLT